jgi:uncharacterized RDD family membrane protein YckC
MAKRRRDHSLGNGVYFAADDYIGLGPRIIISVVDTFVLLVMLWLLAFVWLIILGDYTPLLPLVYAIAVWLYVVPLKRSKIRTVGYRLTKCRLVTLQGTRPSLWMLTLRSLLWLYGPCTFAFDLIWCGIDQERQSMRDRFSLMCLVRNDARSIGEGPIHLAYYTALSYVVIFPRVVQPRPADMA